MACRPVFAVEQSASRQTREALTSSKIRNNLRRGPGSRSLMAVSPPPRYATDLLQPNYRENLRRTVGLLRRSTKLDPCAADAPLDHAAIANRSSLFAAVIRHTRSSVTSFSQITRPNWHTPAQATRSSPPHQEKVPVKLVSHRKTRRPHVRAVSSPGSRQRPHTSRRVIYRRVDYWLGNYPAPTDID